ncbi:dipeptidase [Bradyrhizobium japonicum]
MTPIRTFDGHNDALLRLLRSTSVDPVGEFLAGGPKGHIDLPKAAAGHFVGGFFALYSPSVAAPTDFNNMTGESYALDMPPRLTLGEAQPPIFAMIATLMRVIRRSNGRVALCTTSSDIEAAIDRQSLAVILHLEGADAIDEDLHLLEVAAGRRLVQACNELKIMVDLSHITEKGFFDVARLSKAPLVATHSNAHALCPSPRNLTDRQLAAIRDSGGMLGLNFATCFLRSDGQMRPIRRSTSWFANLIICSRSSARTTSDWVRLRRRHRPEEIGSAAGLGALYAALEGHGYSRELLTKIGSTNWIDVIRRTIG